MYNSSESQSLSQQSDAKYTVADILSSMANGEVITPSFAEAPPIPFSTVASTGLTPSLTPTTLANIEQSFIELSSLAPTTTTATLSTQDLSRQSGFVPPVINPSASSMGIKTEYYSDEFEDSDDDWLPSSAKKRRGADGEIIEITPVGSPAPSSSASGPRRHTGPRPARRFEHLTPEEQGKRMVRRERNKVAAAKCRQRRVDHTNVLINETENLEEIKASLENEIQTLQQQKEQLEFLLKAHKPMCSAKIDTNIITNFALKPEPVDSSMSLSRPNTLSLTKNVVNNVSAVSVPVSVTEATGIAISTPSSGFTTLGLDIMTDGHTGLTPLTGAPSCASQVQRNSSESSQGDSALASPTTLMAL